MSTLIPLSLDSCARESFLCPDSLWDTRKPSSIGRCCKVEYMDRVIKGFMIQGGDFMKVREEMELTLRGMERAV